MSWPHWQRFCILPSTAHWQLKYLSWLPSGFTGFCSCLVPTLTWGNESFSPDSEGRACFWYRFSHTSFCASWQFLTVLSVQWIYHQTSSDHFSFFTWVFQQQFSSYGHIQVHFGLQEKTSYINLEVRHPWICPDRSWEARLITSHLTTRWPLGSSLSRDHLAFSPPLQLLTSGPWNKTAVQLQFLKSGIPKKLGSGIASLIP